MLNQGNPTRDHPHTDEEADAIIKKGATVPDQPNPLYPPTKDAAKTLKDCEDAGISVPGGGEGGDFGGYFAPP